MYTRPRTSRSAQTSPVATLAAALLLLSLAGAGANATADAARDAAELHVRADSRHDETTRLIAAAVAAARDLLGNPVVAIEQPVSAAATRTDRATPARRPAARVLWQRFRLAARLVDLPPPAIC